MVPESKSCRTQTDLSFLVTSGTCVMMKYQSKTLDLFSMSMSLSGMLLCNFLVLHHFEMCLIVYLAVAISVYCWSIACTLNCICRKSCSCRELKNNHCCCLQPASARAFGSWQWRDGYWQVATSWLMLTPVSAEMATPIVTEI